MIDLNALIAQAIAEKEREEQTRRDEARRRHEEKQRNVVLNLRNVLAQMIGEDLEALFTYAVEKEYAAVAFLNHEDRRFRIQGWSSLEFRMFLAVTDEDRRYLCTLNPTNVDNRSAFLLALADGMEIPL